MLNEKMMRDAAQELNEVLGLKPPINVKKDLEYLSTEMRKAIKLIKPAEDEFTRATQKVINEIGGRIPVPATEKKPTIVIPPIEDDEDQATTETEEVIKEPAKTAPKKKTPTVTAKTEKPAGKKKVDTFASFCDTVFLEGGSWGEMIEIIQKEATKRGYKPPINRAAVNYHLKYRMTRNPKYLGKLKITDDGLYEE